MLEYVNLDLAITQEEYKKQLRPLQQRLYELEHAVFDAKIPVIIVFEGWAATGKGRLISLLAERLDPRGFRVVPITPPRTAETRYPWMWRFWLKIPARGQMVAFDTSWYRRVLIDRLNKTINKDELRASYQDIAEFEGVRENQLVGYGLVVGLAGTGDFITDVTSGSERSIAAMTSPSVSTDACGTDLGAPATSAWMVKR